MDILILMAFSALLYYAVRRLSSKTHISLPVLYLFTGILLGQIIKHFGMEITDLFPHIQLYNNILMFLNLFTAGLSINLQQIKESGRITAKLSSLPSYIESFAVSGIVFAILHFAGLSSLPELGYSEWLLICTVTAAPSVINILPVCMRIIQSGTKSEHNITQTMIIVSVLDGIIPVPLMLVALAVSIAAAGGTAMKPVMMVLLAVGVLVLLAVFAFLGVLMGRALLFASGPLLKKMHENPADRKWRICGLLFPFITGSVLLLLICKIPKAGIIFSIFVYLSMCAMGATFNNCDKYKVSEALSSQGSRFFSLFGMPVVFMFVGARINLEYFMRPAFVLLGILVCICAVAVKCGTSRLMLKKAGYTPAEVRFGSACFAPKGIALINFSVIFYPILSSAGLLYILDIMTMLGAVTILLTMTAGVSALSRSADMLIKESALPEDSTPDTIRQSS